MKAARREVCDAVCFLTVSVYPTDSDAARDVDHQRQLQVGFQAHIRPAGQQ